MAKQGWSQIIASQQAAGTLLNTYTTAKSVINPQAVVILPAGYFDAPGTAIEIEAWGGISNIVTTPGTITFQVMLGSVVAFTSGAVQLNATAHTTLPFRFRALLTTRTVGASTSATLMGQGEVAGEMFTATAGQTDGANSQTILQVPATAPAVGTGFDSTVAQTLDFWAGFSINNAGNGIQIQQYKVTSLN
jgi:hypothetical protein